MLARAVQARRHRKLEKQRKVNDDALRRSTEFLVKAKTEYLRSFEDSSSDDEGDISLTGKIRQPGSRLDDIRRRSDPRRWAVPSPAACECLQVQRPQKKF